MKKKLILCVVCILSFMLTGCGSQEEKLDLKKLCNANGDFQFADVEWGSSKKEVEAALDILLEEKITESEEFQAYLLRDWGSLKGQKVNLICEFKKDELSAVSFMICPEEQERDAIWADLSEELCVLYGDDAETAKYDNEEQKLKIKTESSSYLWERKGGRHTALELMKLKNNSAFKYMQISVYAVEK